MAEIAGQTYDLEDLNSLASLDLLKIFDKRLIADVPTGGDAREPAPLLLVTELRRTVGTHREVEGIARLIGEVAAVGH